MKRWRHIVMLVLCVLLSARIDATRSPPLPALAADLTHTTVSGLSSGAYMAGQFAVAFSSMIEGAAIIAGGPYYCAGQGGYSPFLPNFTNAVTACMNPAKTHADPPDASVLWDRTLDFARDGLIDDPSNLRFQSIYLFSGSNDHTVTTEVVDQAQNYYALAGVKRLRYRDDVPAGHGMVTDSPDDPPCDITGSPYFNNCRLPLVREFMGFLYPGLNPPSSQLHGQVLRFDQRPYTVLRSSMADDGYAYVPDACNNTPCRVHVAFHGCSQGAGVIGNYFYTHAGYNEVADANNIIVLYPQVEPSGLYPYNPRGCWDFWGYSSLDVLAPDFHTRQGIQMRAVRAMLERLAEPQPTM
jgi:poly(3-hydroxybutyrate) depolymerase